MAEQIFIIEGGTLTKFECDDYVQEVYIFGKSEQMPGNRKENHNGRPERHADKIGA